MVTPSDGWIVGDGGVILHYSGGTWNSYTSPTTTDLNSVFMVSSTEGWAVGLNGLILHYSEGSWSIHALSPTTNYLYSIQMLNSNEGWAVGGQLGIPDTGTIIHYLDSDPINPVGGIYSPTDKLSILTPYITLVGLIGAITTIFAIRRWRKD